MKSSLNALLIIILLVGLAFPQRKSDRELNKLIGPVRSVHIKKVTYSESGNSSVEFFTYSYEADGSRTDRPYYSVLDFIAQGGSLDNLENPNN